MAPTCRVYSYRNMEKETREFLIKMNISHPGHVCGHFRKEVKGCFKLISEHSDKGAVKLIYTDKEVDEYIVKAFSEPINFVYLTKRKQRTIKSSKALMKEEYILRRDQDAIELHYYEKSTVVYFWVNDSIEEIWISD